MGSAFIVFGDTFFPGLYLVAPEKQSLAFETNRLDRERLWPDIDQFQSIMPSEKVEAFPIDKFWTAENAFSTVTCLQCKFLVNPDELRPDKLDRLTNISVFRQMCDKGRVAFTVRPIVLRRALRRIEKVRSSMLMVSLMG